MTNEAIFKSRVSPVVIVFDAVGTLIQPKSKVEEIYFRYGRQFGSARRLVDVSERFKRGRKVVFGTSDCQASDPASHPSSDEIERQLWRDLVRFVFDDLPSTESLFEALWAYYGCPENWTVYDDVGPCLETLQDKNFELCIGSNFDSRLFPVVRCLLPFFDSSNLFCSAVLGYRKPDRRFYQTIATLMSESREFVMVGDDRNNDFEGPIRFGWQAFLLDRGSKAQDVKLRLKDLSQLRAILGKF